MGWKTKYSIEFKGLKEGLHDYEFEADNKFFEHFDEGLVEDGEVQIRVRLEKRSSFLKLNFEFSGWVELTCDRCLEPYRQDIELDTDIFVKFGEETEFDEGDNVIWVLPEEHVINLSQVIYEYTVLSIPLKHVHPNKTGDNSCNPEMLKKLKTYLLEETEEAQEEKEIDPRWAALRDLKNNN
ncbi:MAG: YceD family protein [Draconibacterium sp.]